MFNFRLRKRYSCPAGAGHADAWIFTHAKAAKAAKVGKGVGELDLGFRMFNFSPQSRDTLTRGLGFEDSRMNQVSHKQQNES